MYASVPITDPVVDLSESPSESLRTVWITGDVGALGRRRRFRAGLSRQYLAEPPVEQQDFAVRPDHHVRRLEVAVDHVAAVGERDRLRDRLEDPDHAPELRARIGALRQRVGERAALDELHGEERSRVVPLAQLVHRDDAGVLELAADLRLLDEALHHELVRAELLAQHLDRDVATHVDVVAAEHDAHPAPGDLALDLEVSVGFRGVRPLTPASGAEA